MTPEMLHQMNADTALCLCGCANRIRFAYSFQRVIICKDVELKACYSAKRGKKGKTEKKQQQKTINAALSFRSLLNEPIIFSIATKTHN